jgi:hypothetical protein
MLIIIKRDIFFDENFIFLGLQGLPIIAGETKALPLEEKVLPQVIMILYFYVNNSV